MGPLLNEFDNLRRLSTPLTLTRDYYQFDPDDPELINAMGLIDDPYSTLPLEGFTLRLNGVDLTMSLKGYINQINDSLNEVNENLSMPISIQEKVDYLKEILNEVEEIESNIKKMDITWMPKELCFENTQYVDLTAEEKEELSIHFLQRKRNLRHFLKLIDLKHKQLIQNPLEKDLATIRPNKKIQLTDDINLIVTLFYDLHDKKYIITSRENLSNFIVNNFLDKNRISLNKSTIDTILKPSKEDKRKTIDKRITIPDK